jgi:hypothetical protein
MSSNPYAPPAAHVADLESVEPLAAKPRQVKVAVNLLWLTLGVGVIRTAGKLQPVHLQGFALLVEALTVVVIFALTGLWTYRISRGGRWARMTYAAMLGLGYLIYFARFAQSVPAINPDLLFLSIQAVLQFTAVVLLFTQPANRWFRRRSLSDSPKEPK